MGADADLGFGVLFVSEVDGGLHAFRCIQLEVVVGAPLDCAVHFMMVIMAVTSYEVTENFGVKKKRSFKQHGKHINTPV